MPVPSPTIKQAVTRSKPFGCIVRQPHTEILSQKEKKNYRKLKNIYVYHFIKEQCTPQVILWKKATVATLIQAYRDKSKREAFGEM